MAGRVLRAGDRGPDVKALQVALNLRAESRFYPPVAVDSVMGSATLRIHINISNQRRWIL